MPLPLPMRRSLAELLFRPRSVALVGAGTAPGRRVLANLARSGFAGEIAAVEAPGELARGADLGVIAADLGPSLEAFAAHGIGAALALVDGDCAATACRLLGPRSFGVIAPASGLDASVGHLPAKPGKLAFVSPSVALCRAVLDWAEPNGVGFSHIVGAGLEDDVDAAAILDMLAREPGVGAILLDIRAVRDRRAFLSAARAASRMRPVIALHAGARHVDPTGRHDQVFAAALRRAGILQVTTLAELFAAAEVMTCARPLRSERLMVVTNAIGAGQLAADQAVRQGIPLAEPDPAAQAMLDLHLPPQPREPGVVWTGDEQPTRPAEAAAMLSALPEVGGIAAVLAPTGDGDAAGIAALAACQPGLRVPLVAAVLGETTGAAHRRTLAGAGVPAFASPEQAVRAFAQLVALRRAREAARELPTSRVLSLAPDHDRVRRVLRRVRADSRLALFQDEALDVLSAYGLPVVPFRSVAGHEEAADAAGLLGFPVTVKQRRLDPDAAGALLLDLHDREAVRRGAALLGGADGLLVQRLIGRARRLRVTVADDPVFGPAIGLGPGGRAREAAIDLPPLNLTLAAGLIARSPGAALLDAGQGHGAANLDIVADALVRISQLVVDVAELEAVTVDPLFADEDGVSAAEAWIRLRPDGERALLAIVPYPSDLVERWTLKTGETVEIRPIRPEDAEAHEALVARLSPEDIRYRFFSLLRELPREQIARMTQIDYDREMAFVAVRDGLTLGVARLVRDPGGDEAEFAIVVDAASKGTGLGRRLMERLIDWGRQTGVKTVAGQILTENARMMAFIRHLGFEISRLPGEADVVEARLDL